MAERVEGLTRRSFLNRGTRATAGLLAGALIAPGSLADPIAPAGSKMRFGLVTYQWGRDWNVPTLIRNLQRADVHGVELRVEHAHGVAPSLSPRQRYEVRLRFENSPVELVGLGTNWAFHYADPARVRMELESAKEYVRLSHDVGGSGVKVKPNGLPDGVPVDRTIEQIGVSLNELARFADDYGQQIRVEVHGAKTQALPIMKRIFDVADHPNVTVCWNSNGEDLEGEGLVHNFGLVQSRLGRTVHVRELDDDGYPYQELIDLFVGMDYDGWILLEARTEPMDRVQALMAQRKLFEQMIARAQAQARAG